MKNRKSILSLVIIIIFVVLITSIFSKNIFLHSYQRIDLDFNVVEDQNRVGFNPDKDALHFGTLPRNTMGFRDFEVHNLDCNKCLVSIKSNISWLGISENNFLLKKDEKKTVKVYLTIPNDAKFGEYNSFLQVYLWKTI